MKKFATEFRTTRGQVARLDPFRKACFAINGTCFVSQLIVFASLASSLAEFGPELERADIAMAIAALGAIVLASATSGLSLRWMLKSQPR